MLLVVRKLAKRHKMIHWNVMRRTPLRHISMRICWQFHKIILNADCLYCWAPVAHANFYSNSSEGMIAIPGRSHRIFFSLFISWMKSHTNRPFATPNRKYSRTSRRWKKETKYQSQIRRAKHKCTYHRITATRNRTTKDSSWFRSPNLIHKIWICLAFINLQSRLLLILL